MTLYCTIIPLLIIQGLQTLIVVSSHHLMSNLSWITCKTVFSPYITVIELMWYQSSWQDKAHSSWEHDFFRIWHANWAKSQILALHQKPKVYHLIPQVKEFLIKLAWLFMLGVMKTWNVQAVRPYGDIIVLICRFYRFTAFATTLWYGSFHIYFDFIKFPLMERIHGDLATC